MAEDLRQWSEQLTAARVSLGQVQQKQLSAQQHVQRLTAQRAELAQQIERIVNSAKTVAERRSSIEADIVSSQREQETLAGRQRELSTHGEELAGQIAALQQQIKSLSADAETFSAAHAEAEQTLHNVQMKIGELRVRLETLVQRTLDELQLDLPARYAEGYEPARWIGPPSPTRSRS